ncbi:MAG TPA: hypothetical protein PKE12_06380 [Kiritimatiellia bacterium]|mgnify:CR=1 FL=1|nr:hypothetical protein [Kiritimatiellia bacterium]
MNRTVIRCIAAALGLLFLYTLALGSRRAIMEAQHERYGPEIPFTLESALYYRRVKIVYDTGVLPAHDPMVQYPEGINPWTTYTAGAEYVYAALARLFPTHIPVPERVRFLEAAWFSLGAPLLALGLYGWRRRVGAAALGGLFHAIAISSVIRSTGHELSHENFALPLLIAHWAISVSAPGLATPLRRRIAEVAAAVLLALALCSWDMVQYYIGLRLLHRAWRISRPAPGAGEPAASRGWWFEYAALWAVSVLNPYHQAQGFLLSAVMGLAHGVALLVAFHARFAGPGAKRIAFRIATVAAGCLATAVLHRWLAPPEAYGHFGELLWAKLRFLNVKPADPALLTFNQRILWVPALNSTDWALARLLFPALLGLTIPAAFLVWCHSRKSPDSRAGELVFATVVTIAAFWLFARFHVYLSLFSCALLGVAWSQLATTRFTVRAVAGLAVVAGLAMETLHTLRHPGRWGRVNVYFKEVNELTAWLNSQAAPDPVLANFGVSGSIAAYGKCAIILHPKFENAGLRQRVQAYGETLFQGTEKDFRDWADAHGARYYVHAFGEFSRESPELQMRYFVNTLDPAPESAARGFEFAPRDRTWFVHEWSNVKYAVFRVITRADEALAAREVARAEAAFATGDLAATEQACLAAMDHFPRQPRALELLRMASALKASGFRAGAEADGT